MTAKTKGTLARPLSSWPKSRLFFLAALLFLTTLFLCCHVSILPFHCSWMRSKQKTAIDECIDSLKIEVKRKIDVILDGTLTRDITLVRGCIEGRTLRDIKWDDRLSKPSSDAWANDATMGGKKFLGSAATIRN